MPEPPGSRKPSAGTSRRPWHGCSPSPPAIAPRRSGSFSAAGRCRPSRPSCAERFRGVPGGDPLRPRTDGSPRRGGAGRDVPAGRPARPCRVDGHLVGAVGPPPLRGPSLRSASPGTSRSWNRPWTESGSSRQRSGSARFDLAPGGGRGGRPFPVRLPLLVLTLINLMTVLKEVGDRIVPVEPGPESSPRGEDFQQAPSTGSGHPRHSRKRSRRQKVPLPPAHRVPAGARRRRSLPGRR